MYQAIFEKFSDILLPVIFGVLVWCGFHYFVMTPRIMRVESHAMYEVIKKDIQPFPEQIERCYAPLYGESLMNLGRWEATLYTASLSHVSLPLQKKSIDAFNALDQRCGLTEALLALKEKQRLEEEQEAWERNQKLLAEQERYKLELQRLREEAELELRLQQMNQIGNFIKQFIEE